MKSHSRRKLVAKVVKLAKTAPVVAPLVLTGNPEADELAVLTHAVSDPRVDVAKLQELRTFLTNSRQERREDRREEAFISDFMAMQAEMPEIDRDGRIEIVPKEGARSRATQVTFFSTFQNINRVVKPILKRHNFLIRHETDVGASGVGVIVRSILQHRGGWRSISILPMTLDTSGSKNNVQGAGSSVSYGKRYNTITLCNITSRAPEDADIDGHAPRPKTNKIRAKAEPDGGPTHVVEAAQEAQPENKQESITTINMEQAQQLATAIKDSGLPLERFVAKYGEPAELPVEKLPEALKALANFKRNNIQAGQAA
jgi:hypothetical protein